MGVSLRGMKFLVTVFLICLFSTPSEAEPLEGVFFGSYALELPDDAELANIASVPADEFRLQIKFLDENGREDFGATGRRRITLLRYTIFNADEPIPDLLQYFVLKSASDVLTAESALQLYWNSSYFRTAPLSANYERRQRLLLRHGESWARIDPETKVGFLLDAWVPSLTMCRAFESEVVCIYLPLDGKTDWVAELELSRAETRLPSDALRIVKGLDEVQATLHILQSVDRSETYVRCCRPLPTND